MRSIRFVFALIIISTMILAGCRQLDQTEQIPQEAAISPEIADEPASHTAPEKAEYIRISAQEADDMLRSQPNRFNPDAIIILDVRTKEEFDEEHIEYAVSLPVNEIWEKAESLVTDKDRVILVYCETGRRSETAAKILIYMGYANVYDFGGIGDWMGDTVNITNTTYVFTSQIHSDLPEFNFHLEGNLTSTFYNNSNRRDSRYFHLTRLFITSQCGDFEQELELAGKSTDPLWSIQEYGPRGFTLDDWNFDGYLDIRILGDDFPRIEPYYYWLWDNAAGIFVENQQLHEIGKVEIRREEKQILRERGLGGYGSDAWFYEYKDGEFVLVKSRETQFGLEDDDGRRFRRTTYMELIDGEMTITKEHDYYP